jgi:hypothetical protein
MKYLAVLTLGILTGLALSRLPHYPLFNDTPPTPEDWTGPKMRGNWSEEERAMLNRYYNGGK